MRSLQDNPSGPENQRTPSAAHQRPLLLPLNQAFAMIGVGRTKGYALINSGVIKTVRVGPRQYAKMSSLEALAENGAAA